MTQEIVVVVEELVEEIVVVVEDVIPDTQVVISEVGLIGPQGLQGLPGNQGPPGADSTVPGPPGVDGNGTEYSQTFYFATPLTTWEINHNQNNDYLSVLTFDATGTPVHGNVRYIDPNNIVIDWYFAMSGSARIYE